MRKRKITSMLKKAFEIVRYTVNRLGEERGAQAAASMAYYGFFSLFPLLLVLVVVASSIFQEPLAQGEVLGFLIDLVPVSGEFIAKNIEQVLEARGSVGALALVGLMWAGSGIFSILARNINRAWPDTDDHAFIYRRFIALVILIVLVLLLITLIVLKNVLPLVVNGWSEIDALINRFQFFSSFLIGTILFVALLILYRWIPKRRVTLHQGIGGALFASVTIGIATRGFGWYLKSGLARYNLVYGSLWTVAALLFWIYLCSYLVIIGTHVSASIAYFRDEQMDQDPSR